MHRVSHRGICRAGGMRIKEGYTMSSFRGMLVVCPSWHRARHHVAQENHSSHAKLHSKKAQRVHTRSSSVHGHWCHTTFVSLTLCSTRLSHHSFHLTPIVTVIDSCERQPMLQTLPVTYAKQQRPRTVRRAFPVTNDQEQCHARGADPTALRSLTCYASKGQRAAAYGDAHPAQPHVCSLCPPSHVPQLLRARRWAPIAAAYRGRWECRRCQRRSRSAECRQAACLTWRCWRWAGCGSLCVEDKR